MTDHARVIIGLIAVGIGVIAYIPYYRDILANRTKPHPFTWLGFSILNAITFIVQVVTGGGPGAWVTAITTVATLGITVLSFTKGEKNITLFDWVCFIGALIGIVLWKLTKSPLGTVIIVTIADLLAFTPTFRKAYLKPREETATLYGLNTLKYALSIPALGTFNFTTAFFPVAIVIANLGITVLIVLRRKVVKQVAT